MIGQPTRAPSPLDLSVVVPTRDRPDRLAACVGALLGLSEPPGEVVVVDSASASPTATAVALELGVRVVRCDRPGASRARNAGWRSATGSIVAFVDDDVRVDEGWASKICAPFARDDVVMVTGGVVAGHPVGGIAGDLRPVAVTDDVATGPFDRGALGNVGASANLAVRRAGLEAVGGFDEQLGAGGRFRAAEDLDLFDRLLALGQGWHVAEAIGFHDPWRNRSALLRLELAYGTGYGVRLAKVLRVDGRRARALARYEAHRLVRDLSHDLRVGYAFGIVSRVGWSAAALIGVGRGLLTPVQDGHLAPRGRSDRSPSRSDGPRASGAP